MNDNYTLNGMNTCRKYIIRRFQLLRKHAGRYVKSKDPESLHQFRVEFKRLKAVTGLISHCHPGFKTGKAYKSLSKAVRQSGKLRDYDVMQELLRNNNIIAENGDKEEAEKNYRKKVKRYCRRIISMADTVRAAEKKMLKGTRYVNRLCIAEYVSGLQQSVSDNIAIANTASSLHDIRKKVKELGYLAELQPDFISPKVLSRYDAVQKHIGNRQDKDILAAYLDAQHPAMRGTILQLQEDSTKELATILRELSHLRI